jgi:hypothetical protein
MVRILSSGGRGAYAVGPGTALAPTGFPDATNTGYLNDPNYHGSLTLFTGTSITSNTSYNQIYFAGGQDAGSPSSHVSNVTFNGCLFDGHGPDAVLCRLYGDNITFNFCTFQPDTVVTPPTPYASGYQFALEGDGGFSTIVQQLTVNACNIWGFGNAIGAYGSTQAKPQVYTNNWVHDARDDGGIDHTDGIGDLNSGGANYVVLHHNTISSAGNTNGVAYQGGGAATYNNFTVTNNLFSGFGYTVGIYNGTSQTNTVFTDNVFSTLLEPTFGPLYPAPINWWVSGTPTFGLWRRNRWLVPAGAQWGTPGNSGKFWIPNANIIVGNNDNPFVSATDYTG